MDEIAITKQKKKKKKHTKQWNKSEPKTIRILLKQ